MARAADGTIQRSWKLTRSLGVRAYSDRERLIEHPAFSSKSANSRPDLSRTNQANKQGTDEGTEAARAYNRLKTLPSLADGVGFEPTNPCGLAVFKTAALNHSATHPASRAIYPASPPVTRRLDPVFNRLQQIEYAARRVTPPAHGQFPHPKPRPSVPRRKSRTSSSRRSECLVSCGCRPGGARGRPATGSPQTQARPAIL
jgi:hypothetical protein